MHHVIHNTIESYRLLSKLVSRFKQMDCYLIETTQNDNWQLIDNIRVGRFCVAVDVVVSDRIFFRFGFIRKLLEFISQCFYGYELQFLYNFVGN